MCSEQQVVVTLLTPFSEAAAAAVKKLTIRLPSQNQHRDANAKLAPKAHHPGLVNANTNSSVKVNKGKKSAEEPDDVVEVLDAPKISKKKRKKKKAHQSDATSEDSDTEPKKKKKKGKAHQRSSVGSDSDPDATELPQTKTTSRRPEKVSAEADTPVAQPKKRGRPRKVVDDVTPVPKVWNVSVFVEIASPPKLQTGKTPRGDKFVNMPATMGGPFVLTRKMGWDKFTEEVADIVDVDTENLGLDGMSWGFQEKKAKLPLTNEHGFQTLRNQIKNHRDLSSVIIIVYHPIPRIKQSRATLREGRLAPLPVTDGGRVQDVPTRWEAKVSNSISEWQFCSHALPCT